MSEDEWIIITTRDPKYWDDGISSIIGTFPSEEAAEQYAADKSIEAPQFFLIEKPQP